MDTERFSGLGLEPVLTTSELADYLGVHVQAIYDLRAAAGDLPASMSDARFAIESPRFSAGWTSCTIPFLLVAGGER